jgi:hypothetical protein
MTELEYRQALASKEAICMFVMADSAPITASMVERNPEAYGKLLNLRTTVLKNHVCALFTDVADLKSKAAKALKESSAAFGA